MAGILEECYGFPVSVKDIVDDNHHASQNNEPNANEHHGIGKQYAAGQRF
jgi:hypothetical protein